MVRIPHEQRSLGQLRQAALTSAPLTVIITWHYPTDYGYPVMWLEDMDFAADAKSLLGESVSEVLVPIPRSRG